MTDFLLLSADDDQLLQFLANHHVVTSSRWCEQCFESCRRDVGRKLIICDKRLLMHIVVVGRGVGGTAEVCSLTLGSLRFICLSGMSVGSTVCGWFSPFHGKIGRVSAARSACFGSNSAVRFSVVQG